MPSTNYKFHIDPAHAFAKTHKKCKKHCRCNANPYALYILAKMKMDPNFKVPKDKEAIEKELTEAANSLKSKKAKPKSNPFNIIGSAYYANDLYVHNSLYEDWEFCLSQKNKPDDCATGCFDFDGEAPDNCHVHPHQLRPHNKYKNQFREMRKLVYAIIGEPITDFKTLLRQVENQSNNKTVCGFGILASYDCALRLAWHSSNAPRVREALLPSEVYLHAGANEGFKHLNHIVGEANIGQPIKDSEAGTTTVAPELLRILFDTPSLPCHHIENLLCIFHSLFRYWESQLNPDRPLTYYEKERHDNLLIKAVEQLEKYL